MNKYDAIIAGSVGGAEVSPQYIGAAEVAPQYIGAPAVEGMTQARQVNYGPIQYRAGDVSMFPMGVISIPAGATITTAPLTPSRPFTPQKLGCPSSVQGLLILNASIGGINLFASNLGAAIELFSEVSTFPQIMWPTIEPSTGITFTLQNPTAAALDFKPTFYGTQVRR